MKINYDNMYFTERNCDEQKLERITAQVIGYFNDKYQLLRMKTTIYNSNEPLEFVFSNVLLKYFIDDPKKTAKPYEVALKYGYNGYSSGGKNGIFL